MPYSGLRTGNFPLFHGRRLTPGRKSLQILLEYYGVELEDATLDRLWAFHQLLRAHNADQDLTRLNAFETIVARHYADCILPNAFVSRWPSPMLDIGSGAGFPGIPLKIVNPHIHLILCEPRPNRVAFLNLVIRELGLKNIEVFGHKVTSNSMHIPVQGIITRAFELIEKTLLRVEYSLQIGGYAYFMKGPAVREELKNFHNRQYEISNYHAFTIPHTTQHRALVILRRIA